MASKNQQYAEQYAEYAMEQMRLYGIPASVTLAQGMLESANGQSTLAQNGNNHFGIKATQSWLDAGGRYSLHTDDKPNEKFCNYDSVADSYTHHSQFLKNNSRYAACFRLQADDYKGWAQGLDRAGYATSGTYAPNLISIIERNNLQKYDQMVMEEMRAKGQTPGQGQGATQAPPVGRGQGNTSAQSAATQSTDYSFPLKRDEFLFITSPFGMRQDPMNPSQQQMHKGIDIRCDNEALLATENNGKVVAVNNNANTAGGKSVTIEFEREDGTKTQVSYLHMNSIAVKVGDTVNAGQQIGVSGNTGTRTTGPHLHFGVVQIGEDSTKRDIDPAAYLAEVAQKGNIQLTAMYNGQDLLAKYKTNDPETPAIDTSLSPDEWMKKLLSSEDSGVGLGGYGHDPVMEMVMTMFTSLMALAVQIDNKSEDEKLQAATDAAVNREIDLTSLVPSLKECKLLVRDGGMPILQLNNGSGQLSYEMTAADMNRLNLALADSSLSNEDKQQRVAGVINNIVVNAQMSQNYQQGVSQGQQETLTR